MSELYLENLAGLSEEDQVRELASLFFTPREIADFIGIDADKFISDLQFEPDNNMVKAYRKGVAETKIKLRFDTKRFALAGSPDAANSMKDYLSKQQLSEMICQDVIPSN